MYIFYVTNIIFSFVSRKMIFLILFIHEVSRSIKHMGCLCLPGLGAPNFLHILALFTARILQEFRFLVHDPCNALINHAMSVTMQRKRQLDGVRDEVWL